MSDDDDVLGAIAKHTPVSFALAFVHAMRKRGDLAHVPSVRTSVALPRFLTARWFRTGALTPKDYVEAAVYLTPIEDQGAAFETARALIFPKDTSHPPSASPAIEALGAPVVIKRDDAATNDDGPSILEDLAAMNLDLGSLDLGALDAALDQKVAAATELKALDLMTSLSTSDDPVEQNLAKLATTFGGAGALEAEGVRDEPALRRHLLERLYAQLGELGPEAAVQAARAGFLDDVIDDVEAPWERAALLAAANDDAEDDAKDDAEDDGARARGQGAPSRDAEIRTRQGARPSLDADANDADNGAAHARGQGAPSHEAEKRTRQGARPSLDDVLDGVMASGDATEIGRTLKYLRAATTPAKVEPFRVRALSSARHLADWAEIVDGLGAFEEPPADLVSASAVENLPRTLMAAGALEAAFAESTRRAKLGLDDGGDDDADEDDDATVDFDDADERAPPPPRGDLRHTAFGAWAASLTETPSLDFLLEVYVPVEHWQKLATLAFADVERALEAARAFDVDARMAAILDVLPLGRRLKETRSDGARQLAARLATQVLVVVGDRNRFLPLLDALIDAKLVPHDAAVVVAAGVSLGIDEDEILARLAQPLEQLRFLIEGNIQDLKRHLDLVDKIDHVPDELLDHLVACCVRDHNLMGLALLLAVALGPTLLRAPAELADEGLQWKGIGGGENLLLQWYLHRDTLPSAFKERVKALARQALIDAALPWIEKGAGGAERGLVPQARTRPYRAGDELENLDVEGTLDQLATSGKSLDQMGSEDLVVSDTACGRTGFGVLIDISGSMSGKDLAVCAVAVVMLLGRLKPEEIALALFESNTHVIKGFSDHRDLDDVAGELLELRATGGTRVDAALRFMADEFAAQADVERRVLFLLSDFCFFEDRADLAPLLERHAGLAVRFLGAAHGHFDKDTAAQFVDAVGGQVAKLPSLQKLPDVLLQALSWIGDGADG